MSTERPPLTEMTLRQLRRVASEYGVSRYSRMRKDQLLASIEDIQRTRFSSPIPTTRSLEAQETVEAAKFDVGQDNSQLETEPSVVSLAGVDSDLAELPSGYGESRIVLMPRDPQWAYTYWDIPNEHKEDFRRQGGQMLAVRLYDVTDINLEFQSPHNVQEYPCDEMAREWYLPIPVSDRNYMIEIGYRCADGRWLVLARSAEVRVPPVYPSDWIEDHFVTLDWDDDLRGNTVMELVPPSQRMAGAIAGGLDTMGNPIYDEIFGMVQSVEAQRVAGSLYGSMQQSAQPMHMESISSYVFPSGMGMWALPTVSGLTMSGAGFSASAPPVRPRKFWLVADAELIVYGATEPDATVTIGGRPIKLNTDGTFRFQMSFQDGLIDFPIMAVAADGEQNREIHMKFERETPSRRTNTKEEAVEEWLVNS
ncbi:DUF4912 domain-containing protein [Myxacorys almedinensis]|uniref:DUF4912 domain-containing protein n=1 Tax=Myxacorys almedinensis A TaxID=2690445 RepID=A0A8J7Z777_9CYAN|nr:DUF4912 domain-containing protein [Myxacorys almedinensis]NDJ16770.1 DUF4912 domain-containing protein [Myxacorys almedinensis A]